MRKTLIQTLLAAFFAILATAPLEGGGVMINMRNAMLSGGGKPTAMNYVQDGLVAMWDGIENVGWGQHDADATTWKDLSGNDWDIEVNTTLYNGSRRAYFNKSCFVMAPINGITAGRTKAGYIGSGYTAIEIVWRQLASTMDLFNPGGDSGKSNGDYGFYSNLKYFQFGVAHGSDRWRFEYNPSNDVSEYPCYAACNFVNGVHNGFFNGGAVSRTDSGAQTEYNRGNRTGLGGRGASNQWVNDYGAAAEIYALRLYSRALTADEIAANCAVDNARFNLPEVVA